MLRVKGHSIQLYLGVDKFFIEIKTPYYLP